MIDDKKIEEAARKRLNAFREANKDGYSSAIIDIESNCMDDFKAGAHWAIEQFLKGLWHDGKEKPKDYAELLVEERFKNTSEKYYYVDACDGVGYKYWKLQVAAQGITRWLYLDDLLSKKGGSDD